MFSLLLLIFFLLMIKRSIRIGYEERTHHTPFVDVMDGEDAVYQEYKNGK
jgi:hypothetical protein